MRRCQRRSGGGHVRIISGSDSEGVEKVGMDLLLRYWLTAKDSAAARVCVVEKQLPRGIDPTKLP